MGWCGRDVVPGMVFWTACTRWRSQGRCLLLESGGWPGPDELPGQVGLSLRLTLDIIARRSCRHRQYFLAITDQLTKKSLSHAGLDQFERSEFTDVIILAQAYNTHSNAIVTELNDQCMILGGSRQVLNSRKWLPCCRTAGFAGFRLRTFYMPKTKRHAFHRVPCATTLEP
jgi:hypothetical protein